jgi:transcriptional regulator with XRE-family HTH domain
MDKQLLRFIQMSLPKRFAQLRKEQGLTQLQMAEMIGIHLTQVKRYESGQAQPSIEILKKIALAFHTTTDSLVFEEGERELPDGLKLQFEAVNQLPAEEIQVIRSLLDGMLIKHQTKQMVGNLG